MRKKPQKVHTNLKQITLISNNFPNEIQANIIDEINNGSEHKAISIDITLPEQAHQDQRQELKKKQKK